MVEIHVIIRKDTLLFAKAALNFYFSLLLLLILRMKQRT